jgi:hypothetical protein
MSELLHRCLTKARTSEGDALQYEAQWITSRRAVLKIYQDRLECGNWRIQYNEIDEAVLCSFRSHFLLPGFLLMIRTSDQVYHFGLNGWWQFWKRKLPFNVIRKTGRIQHSWFSIMLRIILIAYLVHLVLR